MYIQSKKLLSSLVAFTLFVIINMEVLACDQQVNVPSAIHFTDKRLALLGEGIRQELLVDVYHLALYSEADNIETLLNSVASYPVAIRIEILTDVLPDTPPDQWLNLFREVMSLEHFNLLIKNYEKLVNGDVLLIRYSPMNGSSVFMRDRLLFKTTESNFIKAVINGFIGPEPFSRELKQSVLES